MMRSGCGSTGGDDPADPHTRRSWCWTMKRRRRVALRIPMEKGDAAVAPPLGGTRAAVDDDAGAADAEARDDEAVAPSAATLSYDMATSTHVGQLRRAARRGSMRACRECWPERLLRRAGAVRMSWLRLGERSSMM